MCIYEQLGTMVIVIMFSNICILGYHGVIHSGEDPLCKAQLEKGVFKGSKCSQRFEDRYVR